MASKDGRAVARENEIRVLRALHRFGWLRTRDLGSLIWQKWDARPPAAGPSLRPPQATETGLRMAQRTLKRLRENRLVLSAQAPDGSVIYALSEAGARALKSIGIDAVTGKDLVRSHSSSNFRHRCIANEVTIGAILEGFRASSEREIAQGRWIGGEHGIAGKKPDALLRDGRQVWWIEVERSRKNGKDYAQLLIWLDAVKRDASRVSRGEGQGDRWSWAKVVFICTPAFSSRVRHDLQATGWTENDIATLLKFEPSLYSFKDILFS